MEGQDSEGGQAAAGAVVEVTAQPIGAGFRKDAGVTWTKNGLWEARNGELRRPPKAAGGSGVLVLDSEFGGAWVWAGQLAGRKMTNRKSGIIMPGEIIKRFLCRPGERTARLSDLLQNQCHC